jgi:hypothetical protein
MTASSTWKTDEIFEPHPTVGAKPFHQWFLKTSISVPSDVIDAAIIYTSSRRHAEHVQWGSRPDIGQGAKSTIPPSIPALAVDVYER